MRGLVLGLDQARCNEFLYFLPPTRPPVALGKQVSSIVDSWVAVAEGGMNPL